MKKESIIALPDPRLRERSTKVHVVTPEILELVDNLTKVALDWEDTRPHEISAAISAVQIGHMDRVVIIRSDFDDKAVRDFTALINPQIVKFEGDIVYDYEGCLSVPDVYGKVPRHTKVRVKAMDIDGNEVRFKAEDFLARIIQHEVDHINGIVFIDHIRDNKDAFYKLDDKGELKPLNYEKYVKNNSILWD
ncbi:MAG: peptide deformylase [Candidatus Saccharibacteria bacterium]